MYATLTTQAAGTERLTQASDIKHMALTSLYATSQTIWVELVNQRNKLTLEVSSLRNEVEGKSIQEQFIEVHGKIWFHEEKNTWRC